MSRTNDPPVQPAIAAPPDQRGFISRPAWDTMRTRPGMGTMADRPGMATMIGQPGVVFVGMPRPPQGFRPRRGSWHPLIEYSGSIQDALDSYEGGVPYTRQWWSTYSGPAWVALSEMMGTFTLNTYNIIGVFLSDQTTNLAWSGASDEAATSKDWLPLGVFAIVAEGGSNIVATVQLAVNRQSFIRGNQLDMATGQNTVVNGAVDMQTQKVAWSAGDDSSTVYETCLHNLTQEQSTVLVHFGTDACVVYGLMHVNEPPDRLPDN